jgi:repressor of nif and glnA expression
MIPSDDPQIQRKLIEILHVIDERGDAVGARIISDVLKERGYALGERGVRYHLRMLDERGLTRREGYAGRTITKLGKKELDEALVHDRTGFVLTRIEDMIYRTDFDLASGRGDLIINLSFISRDDLDDALAIAKYLAESKCGMNSRIRIVENGDSDIAIPEDHVGIATICSITCDGLLLKHGIPVNTRYGGVLQIEDGDAVQYTDLIGYTGTSIDPMKVFLSRKMTSVLEIAETGSGLALANVRQIPASSKVAASKILDIAVENGITTRYEVGEGSILGVPVDAGMAGISILAGLNVIAAIQEAGIEVMVEPIAAVVDYGLSEDKGV